MKKLSLYIFLVLMFYSLGNISKAETYDELEIRAVKKLQNEYLSCYAFYSISEGILDPKDESLKYIIEQKNSVLQGAMDIEFSLLALSGQELLDDEKLFKENKVYTYHFNFDFEYISTSSLVMLKKLLMEIKSLQDQYPLISVSWIYYQMDEDMRLVGEEMVLITEVKMEVKERNEG